MKWKGRPQSKNVEDMTLADSPKIKRGEMMFGTGERYDPDDPKTQKFEKQIQAEKTVGRLGVTKDIPKPTPRPNNAPQSVKSNSKSDEYYDYLRSKTITKTQVTPGLWKTK